jgi:hypothetical protein
MNITRALVCASSAVLVLGSTASSSQGESDAEQGRTFAQGAKDSLFLRNGGDLRDPKRILNVGYFEGFVNGRVPPTLYDDRQRKTRQFCMPPDLTQYAGSIASYIAENPQIHNEHPTTQVLNALAALWGCKK